LNPAFESIIKMTKKNIFKGKTGKRSISKNSIPFLRVDKKEINKKSSFF
jgi:hypothetical protein